MNVPIDIYGPAVVDGSIYFAYSSVASSVHDLEVTYDISVSSKSTTDPRPTLLISNVSTSRVLGSGADLTVEDTRITATSPNHGLNLSDHAIGTVERTEIIGGYYGASVGNGASLRLRNSIVRDTQKWAINFSGTEVSPTTHAADSSVEFTTFHNTYWDCGTYGRGEVLFNIRNSIVINDVATPPIDSATGTGCRFDYSIIKPQATALAMGTNNQLNANPNFVNAAQNDFHIASPSAAIDMADPATTVTSDYDGVVRPQGAAPDIGAFEYKP